MSRPRVLFVNKMGYDLPLPPALAGHWDAIAERLDVRVVGRLGEVSRPDDRFRLVSGDSRLLGGRAFYARFLPVVQSEIRRFRPDVLSTQSPYEAFACLPLIGLARRPPKLLVQLHGDWRTAARLYGSRSRRPLAPLADLAAVTALRRADGIRAVGPFTARLARDATGREPLASYPTFFDLASFRRTPPEPLPSTPAVAWVGAFERTKNLDGFVRAWRLVMQRMPDARLVMVGEGPLRPLADELVREFDGRVVLRQRLTPEEVSDVLDGSTVLALPSRSEGAPRVIMEAFARGRPVVGARVGGLPDMVRPEENGLLVEPEDTSGLADALLRVLGDRAFAEHLGRGGLALSEGFDWRADEFADALAEVVAQLVRDRT